MERFAGLVMHHRRIVTAFWLLMFVGGVLSAGQLANRWAFDFSLPGQPGDRAGQQVTEMYGVSAADTYVALVTVPPGQTVADQRESVEGVFAAAVAAVPDLTMRVVDSASAEDPGFITDDGRTAYALIQAPVPRTFGSDVETRFGPQLEKAAAAAGFDSGLTSYSLLAAGGESGGTGILVEVLLGAAGALTVLLFVFARAIGLPREWPEATSVLLEGLRVGRFRTIGLGRADDRYFTFCAGLGLDAAVIRQVERARLRGRKSTVGLYLRSMISEYFIGMDRRRPAIRLEQPGVSDEYELATVVIQKVDGGRIGT